MCRTYPAPSALTAALCSSLLRPCPPVSDVTLPHAPNFFCLFCISGKGASCWGGALPTGIEVNTVSHYCLFSPTTPLISSSVPLDFLVYHTLLGSQLSGTGLATTPPRPTNQCSDQPPPHHAHSPPQRGGGGKPLHLLTHFPRGPMARPPWGTRAPPAGAVGPATGSLPRLAPPAG